MKALPVDSLFLSSLLYFHPFPPYVKAQPYLTSLLSHLCVSELFNTKQAVYG